MLTPHDSQNPWPFPCLDVVVRAVSTHTATSSFLAHIDTGADITLIPLTYLQGIQKWHLFIAGPERQTVIVPPALATHTLKRLGYKE